MPKISESVSAVRVMERAAFSLPAPTAQATAAVVPMCSAVSTPLTRFTGLLVSPTAAMATADISVCPSMIVSTMAKSCVNTSSTSDGNTMRQIVRLSSRSSAIPLCISCIPISPI